MDNKQLLADLLSQPGKVSPEHVPFLQEMLQQYPFAQPIHQLLAKADAQFVPKAALYSTGASLYHILQTTFTPEEVEVEAETLMVEEKEADEQEVFEEITEHQPEIQNTAQPVNAEAPNPIPGVDSQLVDLPAQDDSFIESAAAIDFFAFEEKEELITVPAAPVIETVVPDEPEVNFVSKYDDDQLPYTFLWWLAKTRKEHEQIFQPYAQPRPAVARRPENNQVQNQAEFQQQYVEHIFHIQTPFEVADHLAEYPVADAKDAKGAEIIERFLKEDPTIKPPKPEQIDNENKAKKSAEDHYDLVSETLAKIYIEQMLYHKAIDTYKKLSLKYPEKSGYFADLIQSIEKKF